MVNDGRNSRNAPTMRNKFPFKTNFHALRMPTNLLCLTTPYRTNPWQINFANPVKAIVRRMKMTKKLYAVKKIFDFSIRAWKPTL